jgi:PAS domain S-box-containing protein
MLNTTNKPASYPFMEGGGEMGEITRNLNWSATSIGTPDQWPFSLRTTLGILLHSAFPMLLFWGEDLICFYNDAFRPSLGENGKHPAVGKRGQDMWSDIWDFVEPLLKQVMDTGQPVYFEDQLVPFYRNGRTEDIYWTFSYSPAYNDSGCINGVFVTCTETTRAVISRRELEHSRQQILTTFEQAPVGFALIDSGPDLVFQMANPLYCQIVGRSVQELVGRPLLEAIPELTGQGFDVLLNRVASTGEPYTAIERGVSIRRHDQITTIYVDFHYQPQRDPSGNLQGILVVAIDVTLQVVSRQQTRESENRFRSMAEDSGLLIAVGDPTSKATYFSQAWVELTGKPLQHLLNFGWADHIHPEDRENYVNIYISAFEKRESFTGEFRLLDKTGSYRWLLVKGQPRFQSDGTFMGYISSSLDMTGVKQVEAALRASELRLRNLVEQAPVATGLFVGRNLVIEVANEPMLRFWGKGRDVLGKSLTDVLPELTSQPFIDILDHVFTTGRPYHAVADRCDLIIDGTLQTFYFNFTYQPVVDHHGKVYGILDMAVDVTAQVLAQQRLEESEASLRGAIELAELGTWTVDLTTETANYSQRHLDMLGLDPTDTNLEKSKHSIVNTDVGRVFNAIKHAQQPGSSGKYHSEYTIIHGITGKQRIIRALGQTQFDKEGNPIRISGTSQDITLERGLQLALENEVVVRTEELANANQELALRNDELAEMNELLIRSNDNLQKFAYIASHDLQEPLRKITQFGDILMHRYRDRLGDGANYLERMYSASNRMSLLIQDLLNYSRISMHREMNTMVALQEVVAQVLTDLEVVIVETKAQIIVGYLPSLMGDSSQLGQLFQNLLSNALKFSRVDEQGNPTVPCIEIHSRILTAAQVPDSIKPAQSASQYHCIEISDNGVGFEEKYLDRIFEIFQRLHGRSEFSGTGIGLAICEKVVKNHGGAITASSKPGQGATFKMYFPA